MIFLLHGIRQRAGASRGFMTNDENENQWRRIQSDGDIRLWSFHTYIAERQKDHDISTSWNSAGSRGGASRGFMTNDENENQWRRIQLDGAIF